MRGCCAMLLAAAGCSQILGVQDITLGDAGSGSGADTAFTACISDPTITLFKPCFAALPTTDVQLQGTIDTDQCPMGTKQSQGTGKPELCVIAGKNVTVPAPGVRANGSRPLVIAAVTDITVIAMIDVSGGVSVAAAGAQSCTPPIAGGDGGTGGGGGGGAFGASSGGGGMAGGALGSGTGGIGKLMFVRGGCNGAAGGNGNGMTAGKAGTAGGALYLVAGNSVTVMPSATISAAGGGGGGGGIGGGGGGGGASGGLIAIEAPTLGINGVLYANGGGGGGGGGGAVAGQPGQTGTLSTAAGGGGGGNEAGSGGTGGVDTAAAGVGGNQNSSAGGAGGGGGSIGIIWMNYMFEDASGSSVSPPATGP